MWASLGIVVPSRSRSLLPGRTSVTARGKVIPWRSSPRNQRSVIHRRLPAHVHAVRVRTASVRVRSSDHGHWTIGIDGPMKIKFVLIASAVIILSVPVRQSRDVTSVRKNITHCYMVLLPPARRKAVTVGGKHRRVVQPRWRRVRVRYQRSC